NGAGIGGSEEYSARPVSMGGLGASGAAKLWATNGAGRDWGCDCGVVAAAPCSFAISNFRPVMIWSLIDGDIRPSAETLLSASRSVFSQSAWVCPTLPQILTFVSFGTPLAMTVTGISAIRALQLAIVAASVLRTDGEGVSAAWAASNNANGRIIQERLPMAR